MCGFAGIVTWDAAQRIMRPILSAMSARIAHRGPDGEGLYLNHEAEIDSNRPQCGLVHRRLAILDLDERALQPFDDGRNSKWLVFNGEIYNFRELRNELAQLRPDYNWRTTCDTEVLLLACEVWGDKCLDRFNGMYAFAIWDQDKGELFLARDRMGQKPLYYSLFHAGTDHMSIAFASELSALREVPWFNAKISRGALIDYLRWGYIAAPDTIYERASTLAPGTAMRVNGPPVDWFYNPNDVSMENGLEISHETMVQTTRKLVTDAVKRQLVSDVPLGCFLSGGIDSSIIAAAMKASVPADQKVHTFSIGFHDPRYDETEYAAEVAQYLGTIHQQFFVKPDAAEDLPKLAEVYGQPFADSSALPTHYLSRETRKHVKVALSGDGGDELFGGYDRYRAIAISQRIRDVAPLRSLATAGIWQRLPGSHPKSHLTRFKRLLLHLNESPAEQYTGLMRLFDDHAIADLMKTNQIGRSDPYAARYEALLADRDPVQAALALDRRLYLPDDLLTKLDRASMLHALEVRSPFMDHNIVAFAAGLSTDELIKGGGKRMLREAFARDLPKQVFRRRKMGFAVPIGEWFRKDLAGYLRSLLFADASFAKDHFDIAVIRRLLKEHDARQADHTQRLYGLLMLELWWRTQK
ncbi:MAG TPA: asparagine synthase (glutamine-hydrolyzing) [Tepidisphaeraceae bacterium]|nr:asparagine synthase (glutamine-hydrolyzing) [Tepidisphaeraceae bacterium]